MILPLPINLNGLSRNAFLLKPGFLQHPDGTSILRHHSGFNPVKSEDVEPIADQLPDGLGRISFAVMFLAQAVADDAICLGPLSMRNKPIVPISSPPSRKIPK